MTETLTLIARIRARKGSEDVVRDALAALVPPTLEEDGCIEYRLHAVNGDPGLFYFVEQWQTAEDLDRHLSSPHIRNVGTVLEGHVEDSCDTRMTRIA
ncbi:MAG: putative quinol monooxygenase [bacterium]|nr:putative quinol monooxygenase [bacterium]